MTEDRLTPRGSEPPPGWQATEDGFRRDIEASGLDAESLEERLRSTARSAGREVDVIPDGGRLYIRLPVSGAGDPGDVEVAQRLDEVLAGDDVAG